MVDSAVREEVLGPGMAASITGPSRTVLGSVGESLRTILGSAVTVCGLLRTVLRSAATVGRSLKTVVRSTVGESLRTIGSAATVGGSVVGSAATVG